MSPAVLLRALERAGATFEDGPAAGDRAPITKGDFYALGLTGGRDSAARRAALLKALELPERMTANALLYGREEFFPLAEGLTPAGTSPGQSSK